jgi:hypothetical protein
LDWQSWYDGNSEFGDWWKGVKFSQDTNRTADQTQYDPYSNEHMGPAALAKTGVTPEERQARVSEFHRGKRVYPSGFTPQDIEAVESAAAADANSSSVGGRRTKRRTSKRKPSKKRHGRKTRGRKTRLAKRKTRQAKRNKRKTKRHTRRGRKTRGRKTRGRKTRGRKTKKRRSVRHERKTRARRQRIHEQGLRLGGGPFGPGDGEYGVSNEDELKKIPNTPIGHPDHMSNMQWRKYLNRTTHIPQWKRDEIAADNRRYHQHRRDREDDRSMEELLSVGRRT